jgi:hypothetical protein
LVEYKKEQDNKVVDAFSRRDEDSEQEITLSMISNPTLEWFDELKQSCNIESQLQELVQQIKEGKIKSQNNGIHLTQTLPSPSI